MIPDTIDEAGNNDDGGDSSFVAPASPHATDSFAESMRVRGFAYVDGSEALKRACDELAEVVMADFFDGLDAQQKKVVARVPSVASEVGDGINSTSTKRSEFYIGLLRFASQVQCVRQPVSSCMILGQPRTSFVSFLRTNPGVS